MPRENKESTVIRSINIAEHETLGSICKMQLLGSINTVNSLNPKNIKNFLCAVGGSRGCW